MTNTTATSLGERLAACLTRASANMTVATIDKDLLREAASVLLKEGNGSSCTDLSSRYMGETQVQHSDGWRDISSAPKDGTRFLGATFFSTALPGHEALELTPPWRFAVMWWDAEFEANGWDDEKDETAYRAAWNAGRVGSWSYEEYAEETPSHWMPLPPPPEDASNADARERSEHLSPTGSERSEHREDLNSISPPPDRGRADLPRLEIQEQGSSRDHAPAIGSALEWRTSLEAPEPGRKIVALYDDGSGAQLAYVHDGGFIDQDGDDRDPDWLPDHMSVWAYLPPTLKMWCEIRGGDDQCTFPEWTPSSAKQVDVPKSRDESCSSTPIEKGGARS